MADEIELLTARRSGGGTIIIAERGSHDPSLTSSATADPLYTVLVYTRTLTLSVCVPYMYDIRICTSAERVIIRDKTFTTADAFISKNCSVKKGVVGREKAHSLYYTSSILLCDLLLYLKKPKPYCV